jgi:hypothetical protein
VPGNFNAQTGQEEADADSPAFAFRSRFATAAAIFNADFLVVRAGVFLMASNIAQSRLRPMPSALFQELSDRGPQRKWPVIL